MNDILETRGLRIQDKKYGAVASTPPSQPDEYLHKVEPEQSPIGVPVQTIHTPESYFYVKTTKR